VSARSGSYPAARAAGEQGRLVDGRLDVDDRGRTNLPITERPQGHVSGDAMHPLCMSRLQVCLGLRELGFDFHETNAISTSFVGCLKALAP
jgi:hypothetical protein